MTRNKRVKFMKDVVPKKTLTPLQDSLNKNELFCIVCLDLPKTSQIFQCKNSHLLCSNCHQKIIDKDSCMCPMCKIKMSRDKPCRSRLAEKIIRKMIVPCSHEQCDEKLYNEDLRRHERELCAFRSTRCKYNLIGCDWRGIAKAKRKHEKSCPVRSMSAQAILKRCHDRSREREASERRRALAFESDRRVVAALSQRAHNVLVREVDSFLPRKDSPSDKDYFVRVSNNLNEFHCSHSVSLFIDKRIGSGGQEDSSGKLSNSLPTDATRGSTTDINGVVKTAAEKTDIEWVSAQFTLKPKNNKIRMDAIILAGPESAHRFRPVCFRVPKTDAKFTSQKVSLGFTRQQAEDLHQTNNPNLRVILIDKRDGKSCEFTMSGEYTFSYSDDEIYEDYSDDMDNDMHSSEYFDYYETNN